MKKNRMMRLASVLLVCVLLTTSVISGTFAKYTTSDNSSDTARVAKFGVVVTVGADGAFSESYAATDSERDAGGTVIANTVVAASSDYDNLVAPGTGGTLGTSSITGTPEVAVKVTKTATLELEGWEVGSDYYCPLIIKVDNWEFKGMSYASADAFEAAVEGALTKTVNYAPNTDLNTINAGNHTVTWEWTIEGGEGQTNEKDTALGDAAVNGDIKIDFSYVITVEQID